MSVSPELTAGLPSDIPVSQTLDNLDIVRDNLNLMGAFPENVHFRFVLWAHGRPGERSAEEIADYLGPHLENCDAVAIEAPKAVKDEGKYRHAWNITNKLIQGRASAAETRRLIYSHNTVEAYGDMEHAFVLGQYLLETTGSAPTFFPVDDHGDEESFEGLITAISSLPQKDAIVYQAQSMRRRENITINQLFAKARSLESPTKQRTIGVVYGAAHSLLPVAMRHLGANVSRVFLDDSPIGSAAHLERRFRFSGYDGSDLDEAVGPELTEEILTASHIAACFRVLRKELLMGGSQDVMNRETMRLVTAQERLVLLAFAGKTALRTTNVLLGLSGVSETLVKAHGSGKKPRRRDLRVFREHLEQFDKEVDVLLRRGPASH